ncbi:MAG: tetratricopeptide repeat protein [Alphaproteobacteria bacterium]|nr:tetratricopeptide repeat protein [Alphaproteobacteria bacterium]
MEPSDPDLLDEAVARLGFHLGVQDGFWLALAVSNDARTREALRRWAETQTSIRVHRVLAEPREALIAAALDDFDGITWIVADGDPDRWEPATAELLLALNERREALRRVRGALVFEGRERLKAVLRNLAPDLFSIRACILETGTWPLQAPHADLEAVSELDRFNHAVVAASLEQAQRLAHRDDLGSRRSRVGALTRAAEALIAQGWFGEAAPVVEELRVEAYRLVAEQFSERWALSATALSESLTGAVERARGDLGGAVNAFGTAVFMRDMLHDEGDVWSARDLVRARSELGQTLLARGDLDGAEKQLTDSAEMGRGLLAGRGDDPELASQVALTLSVLGDLYLQKIDRTAAREVLEHALAIRQDLAATGAARFRRYLGIAWGRMGALAEIEGDLDEALAARRRAADIAHELAEEHPDNAAWDMEYATTLGRVGEILLARGEIDAAEEVLSDASNRATHLSDEDPENARWKGAVASSLLRLSAAVRAKGDAEGSVELVDEAVELFEQLVQQDPTNKGWRRELAAAQLRRRAAG